MKLNKLFLSLLFIALSTTAFAQQTSNELKALKQKKEAIERQIELAQRNLNKTTSGKKLTLSQINTIKAQVRLMQEKISTINSEMRSLDNQITENTGKVHNLQTRLSDLKKEYAGMIRFAQRNRNSYDKMMFIFAAKDFNQGYKRIKYLQQFGQYRKKQAAYIQGTEKDLNNQISVLDRDLKNKLSLLKQQESEKSRLDRKKSEQAAVLNNLSKDERKYRQDIQKNRQQQAAIDRQMKAEINRIIEAERRKEEARIKEAERLAAAKAKAEGKVAPVVSAKPRTTSQILRNSPEDAKLSDAFENNKGNLPWPVASGVITTHFGPYTVGTARGQNDGVVYQTSENASVRAVFNGKVSKIRNILGKYIVIIRHGEYFTIYQNLKNVSVSEGTSVTTKQAIGTAANNDGTPEVGFQINRGGIPLPPESWVAR
ncbi:peptidase M23 [Pedobacter polaris]|uniref:Peptidase M23 n=1 Tax=Pedobacter polaris TaxID=2571273 RepID=A0A4U1CVX3_9SPHI|nr:peptidoglycan DD-metalloendopeptidase family protein [Pedobacter polaris]TKC13104.1 peptidase M23 [Pedobacter polaris]